MTSIQRLTMILSLLSISWIIVSCSERDGSNEVHVAVASNFSRAAEELAEQFTASTGHTVSLSFGSTGKHYAQIQHGAPFDVFLAADNERPKLLESDGFSVANSRMTYAIGKIVLWSPKPGLIDEDASVLRNGEFSHLSIANPRLAPYGQAAQEVLDHVSSDASINDQIVLGENISQAMQFIISGHAELGLIAQSQWLQHGQTGSHWIPPQELYTPIHQDAVLLKESAAARSFLEFLRSESAKEIIRKHGYDTP